MDNIGSQLRDKREGLGFSIEDVAHKTRVSARQLRALEENDYSEFASLTYGRYFLSLYSDFLGIDTSTFQNEFPSARLGSSDNYAYLQEPEEFLRPSRNAPAPRKTGAERREKRPEVQRSMPATSSARQSQDYAATKSHPLLLMGLLCLLGGAIYWFFFLEPDTASAISGAHYEPIEGPRMTAPAPAPVGRLAPSGPAPTTVKTEEDAQVGSTSNSAERSPATTEKTPSASVPTDPIVPAVPASTFASENLAASGGTPVSAPGETPGLGTSAAFVPPATPAPPVTTGGSPRSAVSTTSPVGSPRGLTFEEALASPRESVARERESDQPTPPAAPAAIPIPPAVPFSEEG